MAARDQTQKGLRALRQAILHAPLPARDSLQRTLDEATAVWKRMSRPAAGDADLLAASSEAVDEARRQLRAFRPSGVVAK